METKKRQHNALSLATKVRIIQELDRNNLSKTEIAKKFNIPKSTLSRILKNKGKIEEAVKLGNFATDRMRMRTTAYKEIEDVLFLWFKRARSANFPISGPILEEKAKEIATRMGIEDFRVSDGWLSRFKKRHGLVLKTVSGESAAVNRDICSHWQQGRLQEILETYEQRDVFNIDEMGLFYKALPTKTLAYKGETCVGGKRSKDRITVLVGANMDGSEKLKMVVVGKSKHPRCFKGVRMLPVTYHANGKAWMTQAIFETWLREEDRRFAQQNRKVIFIVDQCPAHGQVDRLKSISLEFLPPNATAIIQPMDQGIIQNLKVLYRRQVLQRMLLCADNKKDYNVDLLSALHILTNAWECVKVSTVQRCFHHAGFSIQEVLPDEEDNIAEAEEADILFSQVTQSTSFTREDYETLDANVATCREDSLEELIAEVQDEDPCSSGDEMVCDPGPISVPDSAARDAVILLQRYFEHNGGTEFLPSLSAMHSYFVRKCLNKAKQTVITSFFPSQQY